jgi:hypothetical protein
MIDSSDEFEVELEMVICTNLLLRDHKNSSTVREIDVWEIRFIWQGINSKIEGTEKKPVWVIHGIRAIQVRASEVPLHTNFIIFGLTRPHLRKACQLTHHQCSLVVWGTLIWSVVIGGSVITLICSECDFLLHVAFMDFFLSPLSVSVVVLLDVTFIGSSLIDSPKMSASLLGCSSSVNKTIKEHDLKRLKILCCPCLITSLCLQLYHCNYISGLYLYYLTFLLIWVPYS